jgi:hypothetical protein
MEPAAVSERHALASLRLLPGNHFKAIERGEAIRCLLQRRRYDRFAHRWIDGKGSVKIADGKLPIARTCYVRFAIRHWPL